MVTLRAWDPRGQHGKSKYVQAWAVLGLTLLVLALAPAGGLVDFVTSPVFFTPGTTGPSLFPSPVHLP
eukprot:12922571-Prorocentrum_lima.AAC.1